MYSMTWSMLYFYLGALIVYLIQDIEQTVVDVLLREYGCTVIVLVLAAVVLHKKLFEGHRVLFFEGHHQLVAETKKNELERKQQQEAREHLHFVYKLTVFPIMS